MKILHLADLHLGKNVVGLSMIDNQRYVLNQAIELCKKENIKHIIISGDVYDRSIPPEEAVNLLNNFLSKAVLDEKIQVYMISGNHDSKERLACFNGILEKQGLFIDSGIKKDLKMNKYIIKEDNLTINIYSLPYIYPGEVRVLSQDDTIKDFESSVVKILDANEIIEDEINILNAHYFVAGSEPVIRSDSEMRTSVGTIEQISYKVFDKFDYVALGHLHCPQHVGRKLIRYAGSPLRYSVDEIKQHKVFTIINIKSKDDIEVEKREIVPLYEFVELEGSVDDLTKNSEEKDYRIVFFKLTDERHVLNAAARLKIKYPHYVGLIYVNIKEDVDEDESNLEKEEGFQELPIDVQFDQFFQSINGKGLDEIQKDAVNKVMKALMKEGE